jgi:hypothetical protein
MAVPTFTSIDPALGPAGGRNTATIVGTNFRVPSSTEGTVKVEFDGIEALNVDVMSATELFVYIPPYRGEGDEAQSNPIPKVDIRIYNIDDDGDPIVGETVTATSAYAYQRSPIRLPRATQQNQTFRQIIYETIWAFQRQLVPNVGIGTSVDYGDLGQITIKEAEIPSITLVGPRISEDFENRHRWHELQVIGEEIYWPAWVGTFEFDAVLASNSKSEMYGMIQGLHAMFIRTPYLKTPITPGSPNAGEYKFPFVLTAPPTTSFKEPNSDLLQAAAGFQVRWIPFLLDQSVDEIQEVLEGNMEVFGNIDLIGDYETILFAHED